jgi:hypothetical protein
MNKKLAHLATLAATAALLAVSSAEAAVLCAKKDGAIATRARCKAAETRVDLKFLTVQGPPGPQGPAGPQGAPGDPAPQPPQLDAATVRRAAEAASYTLPLNGTWNAANVEAAGSYALQLIAAAVGGDMAAAAAVPDTTTAYLQALRQGYAGSQTYTNGFNAVINALAPAQQFAFRRFAANLQQDPALSPLIPSNRASAAANWWHEVLALAQAGNLDAIAALPEAGSAYLAASPSAIADVVAGLRSVAH